MKISRGELHRRIAERLEPKPSDILSLCGLSGLGFWFRPFEGVTHRGEETRYFGIGEWRPVNFSTSEDASARLRRAMPSCSLYCVRDTPCWACNPDWTTATYEDIEADDDLTAVLLAAKSWLGIEGELDGVRQECRSLAEAHAILNGQYGKGETYGGKVVDESIESREVSEWKKVEDEND